MTTVVSNSAALMCAWSGSLRSSETPHHLVPFFPGLPCLVGIAHCLDRLWISAVTLIVDGEASGLRYTSQATLPIDGTQNFRLLTAFNSCFWSPFRLSFFLYYPITTNDR